MNIILIILFIYILFYIRYKNHVSHVTQVSCIPHTTSSAWAPKAHKQSQLSCQREQSIKLA